MSVTKGIQKNLLSAIDKYITLEEVKELLYQSVIYVGFDRVHNFFGVVIRVFDKKGMGLSLETRSNTSPENRRQKGREIQDRYFGTEMIQAMNDNVPEDQKNTSTHSLKDSVSETSTPMMV